jgi:O-antigen/teichoic acid export membrane protein
MRAETITEAAPEHGAVLPPQHRGLLGNATWSALDFWAQQATALLVFILVGNIIGPAAVGLVTVAQLAVTLLMTLLLDGFSDVLVQRRSLDPEHVDTAFLLMAGLGTGAALLLWATAPLIAALFGEAELRLMLPVLAIGLPFVGIAAVYQSMLQRDLRFPALAVRSALSQLAGFAAAFLLARAGKGAWALVGYFVCVRVLDAALLAAISRLLPGLRWSQRALADIVGFGRHRVGNQIIGFVVMQVDRFSTGLFLGPVAVGLFSTAERISTALISGLSGVLGRVAFPVLSARQADPAAFRQGLEDVLLVGNALAFPAFVGVALVSHDLVGLLFSAQWAGAAAPLALLALAGIPHASNYMLTAAINACGRPDVAVRYSLVIMAMRLAASLAAAQQGVLAVAWANLVVTVGSTFVVLALTRRHLPGAAGLVGRSLPAPVLATAAMAGAVAATGLLLPDASPAILLPAKIAVGALGYGAALLPFARRRLGRLAMRPI